MIRVKCPGCGTTLDAKDSLAGQTRNCPKCKGPIEIPAPEEPTPIIFMNPATERLPSKVFLERLSRANRYVICDKTMVIATWRNDGQGWMLRAASGFVPARRDSAAIPHYGDFVLVELEMAQTDVGLRLAAINSFQLATRFALTKLEKSDDDIVQTITDYGRLNREQKFAVRQVLRDEFLREVWCDSTDIVDYLSNADYHSHTTHGSEKVDEPGKSAAEGTS
ncbi:MAG TPA: hypothetical protein VJL29_10505 [Thermoguttaceae bacterium]|nr:hypothetical protein [Thermoguttaceae bacterium]